MGRSSDPFAAGPSGAAINFAARSMTAERANVKKSVRGVCRICADNARDVCGVCAESAHGLCGESLVAERRFGNHLGQRHAGSTDDGAVAIFIMNEDGDMVSARRATLFKVNGQ